MRRTHESSLAGNDGALLGRSGQPPSFLAAAREERGPGTTSAAGEIFSPGRASIGKLLTEPMRVNDPLRSFGVRGEKDPHTLAAPAGRSQTGAAYERGPLG
jgi:hypothetical protein